MESIFLFCFRSCLRGSGENKELYERLGLQSSSVSLDEIKKAYKKKSLNLHPDKLAQKGITVTEAHSREFLQVKEAYDILSDPKRRKRYDQIGMNGLKLMENPTEVDPSELLLNFQRNRSDRLLVVLLIFVVFSFFVYMPVLLCIKSDGGIRNYPWLAIWIPGWIFDLILLLSSVLLFTLEAPPQHDGSGNGDATQEDAEKNLSVDIPVWEKIYNLISTVCFVIIQIFILIRMDHFTEWNWYTVFIPWFIYECLRALYSCVGAFTNIPAPDHKEALALDDPVEKATQYMAEEAAYGEKLDTQYNERTTILQAALRIWFACFLASRLNGSSMNWGLVFLPVWVGLFIEVCLILRRRSEGYSMLAGIDVNADMSNYEALAKAARGQQLVESSGSLIGLLVPLFIGIMIVCRLQLRTYSTFLILLPVFIALGCMGCCIFVGLYSLATVDVDKLKEEMEAMKTGQQAQENTPAYSPPTGAETSKPEPDVEYGTFKNTEPNLSKVVTVKDVSIDLLD